MASALHSNFPRWPLQTTNTCVSLFVPVFRPTFYFFRVGAELLAWTHAHITPLRLPLLCSFLLEGLRREAAGVAETKEIRHQRHRIHDGQDLAFRRQGEEDNRASRPRLLQGRYLR